MCIDEQLFPWCLQQKARQVQQAHPARDRNDTQAPTALFKDLIWHYPLPHWEQKITSQGAWQKGVHYMLLFYPMIKMMLDLVYSTAYVTYIYTNK